MVSKMNNKDIILPVDSVPQYQPMFEPKSTSSEVVLPVDIKPNTEVQYYDSLDVDPNHAAKVVSISNKLKESPLYVNDNLAQAEKLAQAPKSDFFKKLEERYPGTSKYLLRGANMALAKDDIDNLAWYEDVVGQATKGYKIGALNVEQATLAKDQILEALATGQVPTVHEDKLKQLETQMEKDNQNPDGFKPVFWASQQVPNFGLMAQYAGANALIGGAVGATAGTIVPGVGTTAGAAVGIGTGVTMGLIEASAVLEGGSAFREYIKLKDKNGNPIDPKLAAGAALVAGGINAGLELVTLKALAKTIPGADKAINYFTKDIPILNKLTPGKAVISAVKDYLVAMGTEAATEVAQETVTGGLAQGLQGQLKPGELGERVSQVINPAVQSAFLFGLPGTGMRIAGDLGKVRQASNDKQVYLDLGNAAKQSKLKERLPEGHTEFQIDVTKDTPVENVYIPVEKFESYFQDKKIDPTMVAKELGVEDKYNQVKESGGNLEVPTATWVDKVIGTEHYQALADDVKFTPEGLTVNETVEAKAQIAEALKYEQAAAQDLIAQNSDRQAGYDEVYNYIKNEQANSPKPEGITVNDWSKTIDNNAKLWAAHAVAESARQGKTVQEWFTGINKPTVAKDATVEGQTLAQSEATSPAFYSKLERTIQDKMPNNAPVDQVRGLLKEIKPEEMQWSGINDFLEGKDKVNKDELISFLQDNQIQIQQVINADKPGRSFAEWAAQEKGITDPKILNNDLSGEKILFNEFSKEKSPMPTKFSKYVLPGGENYREVLFTLPNKENKSQYRSSHWDEPNVLAHTRLNDRVDSEGNKVLFVEEIQSDWHQEGRKKGYKDQIDETINEPHVTKEDIELKKDKGRLIAINKKQNTEYRLAKKDTPKEQVVEDAVKYFNEYIDQLNEQTQKIRTQSKTPSAPFKKTWPEFVFKKILDQAVRSGSSAWNFITQPKSARTEIENYLGSKFAPMFSLEPMNALMLKAAKNDKILGVIVKSIPVDVVNILSGKGFTPEDFFSKPNVVFEALTVDGRSTVASGMQDALKFVGTSLRTALNRILSLESARGNGELFSTISASDLDPSIIVGLLSPSRVYTIDKPSRDTTNTRIGGTDTRAKSPISESNNTRVSREPSSTELAFFLNWHDKLLRNSLDEVNKYIPSYEKISWATGEIQAARYDLSKQVNEIRYKKEGGGYLLEIVATSGDHVGDPKKIYQESELSNFVGKEVSEKIIADKGEKLKKGWSSLEGEDLKVGGEGMKGFYDKILPELVNKYTKKWGGKTEESKIGGADINHDFEVQQSEDNNLYYVVDKKGEGIPGWSQDGFESEIEAETALEKHLPLTTVHSLEITPQMRSSILKEGQTLFQGERGKLNKIKYKSLYEDGELNISANKGKEEVGHLVINEDYELEDYLSPYKRDLPKDVYDEISGHDRGIKVEYLEVNPEAQHQGIGFSLMLKGLEESKKIFGGDTPAYINASPMGIPGKIISLNDLINFYSKFGFKEIIRYEDDALLYIESIDKAITIFQENEGSVRGSLQLIPDQSVITLFKNADQSTFIHESGHLWLKDTLNFIQSGQANEQYQADWNTLKEFLNFKDDQTEFTVDQQEQFARSFEAYLMEGKAPSEGLKSVFAAFKRWLTRIYRNIAGLNVELTDPVRKVMDRMIATEDEIAQAESQSNFMSSIDFKDVPPEVKKKLSTLRERAKEKAERTLLKEQMQELTKEYEKQYSDKLVQITKEEQAVVNDMPIYTTMRQIGMEFKKNPTLLADNYIQKKMKPETEARFNVIAELSGFTSGDELAQTIKQTKKLEDTVKERVANRMQEFAPLKDQAIIKQKALEAIHNNYSLELLASERELLNEMIKGELTAQQKRKTNAELTQNKLKLIKEQARNTLLNTPVKDLSRFSVYYTAERNAAVKSAKAFAKGDIAESLKYKDQQLLNHALATESSKLRKAIDRSVAYLKSQQIVNRDTFKKSEHLYQAAALLRRFGFERSDFIVDLRNESLSQWAERMQQVTNVVDLPDWILDETKGFQDFRELTFDQLHEVAGAIKNIKKVASMEDRVYSFGNKVTMSEVVNDLVKSQRESGKSGKTPELSLKEDWTQKVIKRKDSVKFSLLNTETLLRGLDKYKTFGNWWDTFYKPINEAANEKVKMLTEASLKYRNIFEVYSKKERQEMADKKIFIPELNNSLTKNEILAMALNWGNEINRKRLIEGRGWNESQITTILNKYLDKRDWDTVQNVWDLVNSYWSQIARLYEELTGFAPTKVEATSITTKYGVYKGGYYPLKSDPRSSVRGFQEMAVDAALAESANPTWKAMTKNGHTKERTANAKYAVSLDLTVIARHLHDVIHDITHRKAIIDINRLLANQDVQNAVIDAYGMEGLQTLKNWEKALAGENPQSTLDWVQRLAGWARRNTVIAGMGMRLSTMFQQFTGFFSTVAVDKNYGWTDMATSVWDYYGKNIFNPGYYGESVNFVTGKSSYMKDRITTLDRDIADTAKNIFGQKNRMSEFAMSGISFFDRLVTIPTWMQAYKKGLELYKGDEAKSIQWADYIVRRSQGSGMMKDLPAMMRGSEGQKVLTMFYSYMNTQLNLFYENTDQTTFTNSKDLGNYMGKMMALWIFPVVFSELLAFRAPLDDDKSEEDKLKFWTAKILQYPFGLFPVVRDVANVAIDAMLGMHGFGYKPSPASGAIEAGERMIKAFTSDRADAAQKLEAITKLGSYVVPYPDQFNVWFWNVNDYLFNDMNPRISDIVRRRPKRERNE